VCQHVIDLGLWWIFVIMSFCWCCCFFVAWLFSYLLKLLVCW